MSADVQEPFNLSFQVESLHSGSISFGRFEVESLSWERRSSFSHNRYLEEVEKYAIQGSVTEKKAYFEAHFRRKALLRQASSESQAEKQVSVNENGSYEQPDDHDHHNDEKGDACHFDESPESSCCEGGDSKEAEEVSFNCYARLDSHEKSALDSADQVENVVKSCDNEQTFETRCENDCVLTSNVEHCIEVELKSNDQAQDVITEECSSQRNEATGSGLGILPTNPSKLRAADKTRSSGMRSRYQGYVLKTLIRERNRFL